MKTAILSLVVAVTLTTAPVWGQIVPVPDDQYTDLCPGDFNDDGVVNSDDLGAVLGAYGVCRGCDEDLNRDGYVDESDVKIVAMFWGPCSTDEGPVTLPARWASADDDGPEIFEGDGAENDAEFSDEVQPPAKSLVQHYRRLQAAPDDGPEIFEGDGDMAEGDDEFSVVEQPTAKSLTRSYRRPLAVSDDGAEIFEGDGEIAEIEDQFSDVKQPTCDGDLNGDGQVDSTDLALLLQDYGPCRGCEEDLNGDRRVDDRDIDILFEAWGSCPQEKSKKYSRSLAATDGAEIEEDRPPQHQPEDIEAECPGDLDGSGKVDTDDLAIVLGSFGRCSRCDEDFNGDGYVDEDDVDILMANWGTCDAEAYTDLMPKKKTQKSDSLGG